MANSVNMDKYEELGCLHEMFKQQAKATPNKIAVVSDDGQMTFKELDDVTDLLAQYLRILGVTLDKTVGIYMERCLEYAIAYIAILKAGGSYMPIDVSYPVPLLKDIIQDSEPVAICAQESVLKNLKGYNNAILLNKGWIQNVKDKLLESSSLGKDVPKVRLDNLAYTVYSSGTTGKPKGIECPHRGAVFSYHHRHQSYPYKEDDKEACNVFFVWEMLRPLLKGVTMYIIPDNVIYDPKLLTEFIYKHGITRMLFTPSLLEAVLDSEVGSETFVRNMTTMRTVLFCGEVVTTGLLDRCIKALTHVLFVNLYSVSEAHDLACANLTDWYMNDKNAKSSKFCPVGKVLPGVHVVILDESLQPQPTGVPGEIYVGGPTLARGYLNRPDLNASRFIRRPNSVPEKVGPRLYKTGDWGYMLSNGSFEICGRCDSMVKIRGYSVEVQAVEAALLEMSMVNACVVVVMGNEGEDKYLVGYIVPEGTTTKKEVRAMIKKRLPFYMVPSYFVFLNSIPIVAATGKLNKKALPQLDKTETTDAEGRPSTETEAKLLPLWKDVLHLMSVDTQESFFDLGGHSLIATKLLNKVNALFEVELCVRDLFTYTTISAMGKLLDKLKNDKLKRRDSFEGVLDTGVAPKLDLQKEVESHDQAMLSMDIQLRAFWRSMQFTKRWEEGRVLLTGATGFLGAFLLKDLLKETKTHIYCLVREQPDQVAVERVRSSLIKYGILASPDVKATDEQVAMETLFKTRVNALKGDVGLVNLGLSEDDYAYMCTEIDFIIHSAAVVNLIYPYQAMHGTNVLGTENILLFACTTKIKPLHFISTDAVYPHGLKEVPEDYDMVLCKDSLDDGYSQSKWVAEQLVLKAMERGLPAAVYRPGNLSGDMKTGRWNPQDFNLLMLLGCLHSGSAPKVDWDVEFTPVDFLSSLVVNLCKSMGLGLGKVFNVTNTKPIKSEWLFEWISAHGYPLKMLPYEEWKERIKSLSQDNKDMALLERILDSMISDETWFSKLTTYRNDNLLQILETLELQYPAIDNKLLKSYFHSLTKQRKIPRARQNTTLNKPLDGQVAVVTGASGGIGAAIALHLARAGAAVALIARREDKLEENKKLIESEGGVAIGIKCDVVNRQQVNDMAKHVESVLGPVNILVNNAGVMYYTMMKNLNQEQWDKTIDINCKGVLNCIGAFLDGMIKRGKGHIVNMSSDAGRRGFAGLAVYSGTKFFVEGLSQGMRTELAKTGVKITCIQPGDVRSELLQHTTDVEAKETYDGSQSTKILEPEDIGKAVVYAVSQPFYVGVNEILIEPRESPI